MASSIDEENRICLDCMVTKDLLPIPASLNSRGLCCVLSCALLPSRSSLAFVLREGFLIDLCVFPAKTIDDSER